MVSRVDWLATVVLLTLLILHFSIPEVHAGGKKDKNKGDYEDDDCCCCDNYRCPYDYMDDSRFSRRGRYGGRRWYDDDDYYRYRNNDCCCDCDREKNKKRGKKGGGKGGKNSKKDKDKDKNKNKKDKDYRDYDCYDSGYDDHMNGKQTVIVEKGPAIIQTIILEKEMFSKFNEYGDDCPLQAVYLQEEDREFIYPPPYRNHHHHDHDHGHSSQCYTVCVQDPYNRKVAYDFPRYY